MMAFDLGGPVNKVAYSFAVAGLGAGTATNVVPFEIMAAVMAAGMVPPLALALASTVLYRKGFTKPERENGKAAWLLGASFISEGAIPFAAADPLRVIPASMVGAAVTGAISMAAGVTSRARTVASSSSSPSGTSRCSSSRSWPARSSPRWSWSP